MNVLDLAMAFGLQPFKKSSTKGGQFSSSCPFCGGIAHPNGERSDRFQIWPDQNSGNGSYWCSRCGAHGDRIQFVMDTQHLGFKAACRVTGDDAIAAEFKSDSDAPYTPRIPVQQKQDCYVPQAKPMPPALSSIDLWREKSLKLVMWAAGNLPGSQGEQLLIKKGISMETARAHGLGWIPEDIYRTRESWGLTTVVKEDTGKPKRLWIPSGLVIPHFLPKKADQLHFPGHSLPDPDGSGSELGAKLGYVQRLRIRRPEGELRYYIIPGSGMANMILSGPTRCVTIVESELDAILLSQMAGDITTVISMGSSHAKPDESANHVLQAAPCILIALDSDSAGKSSFLWWKNAFPKAVRWPVTVGKDPSDAHSKGMDLRSWVVAGWPAGWRITQATQRPAPKTARMSDGEFVLKNKNAAPVDSAAVGRKAMDTTISHETDTSHDTDRSGPLYELQGLMSKNPKIRIVINNFRMSIQVPPDWQARNPYLFGRMSRLVYFDPTVFEHLHNRGTEIITCDNLM
ncbi:MAG: CHC2 zinc finger domain-containing protein [Pseudomonadota bacterium]